MEDAEVDRMLHKLLWPRSTQCREMLAGAHECVFQRLPDVLVEELEEASICQAASVLCENAHKIINADANHCPNGAISMQQKWRELLGRALLEEQELPYSEPTIEHEAEAIGKAINPKEMFEGAKSEFSFGEAKIEDLLKNVGKLHFPGPTGYFPIGAVTSAIIETGEDPKKYKMNWSTLLAQRGTSIYHQTTGYLQHIDWKVYVTFKFVMVCFIVLF